MIELLIGLGSTVVLVGLGFSIGGFRERSHFKSLAEREAANADVILNNLKTVPNADRVKAAHMVSGNTVVATDYFKTIAMSLRSLVGGEMKSAQTLMVRARREALLRMIDEARAMGATEVYNVRFAFCNIGQMSRNSNQNFAISVEMYAYGTAVIRK